MTDILEYSCNEDDHNHYVDIDGDIEYVCLDDEARTKVYPHCRDGEYSLYELITENDGHIPYVVADADHIDLFSYVVKRLYNHTGIVAYLDEGVICCPDMRVDHEKQEEIHSTFSAVCKERGINYEGKVLEYIPLSSPIVCYKDSSEIPVDMAINGDVASALASGEVTVSKRKTKAAQVRKEAIGDAILLSKNTKISDRNRAIELCQLISKDRSRDMHHYISLGRCLHHIFRGEDEGLDLWIGLTIPQKHESCREYWPHLGTTSTLYTIRFLQYCAKLDNPEQYNKWNSTSVRAAIEESVMATGGPLDVATAAYRLDPSLYISEGDNYTESVVYKWNGTYYEVCGEYDLRNHLDKKLIKEYKSFLREMAKTIDDTPENSVKEMLQRKMDNAIRLITKLKDDAYQLKVIKVLCRLYNIPGFSNMKNRNRDVFIFDDCIFDCERKEMRKGIPEDYMTISTHYSFAKEWEEYHWDHPLVKLVNEHIEKILFEDSKRDYFWYIMCRRLRASNAEKKGFIWYGPTGNAKSHLCSWLMMAFGRDYFPTNIPSNLLYSDDAHPGTATPQWEALENARMFAQSEISDANVMNEGNYKRVTGSIDTITYRALYGKKIRSFIPACVPITVCNSLPKFNGNSAALRARILLLKLWAKFISEGSPEWEELMTIPSVEELADVPEEEKEEFIKQKREEYMENNHWYYADENFHSIIEKTYKAMIWILIQKFIEGRVVEVPNSILMDTIEFFNKANIYLQFVRQCVRKDQAAAGVSTYALYSVYKKWYSDNISRFGQVAFPKFLEEAEAIRVVPIGDMFRGISVIYK